MTFSAYLSVWLCVSLSVGISLELHWSSPQIFVHVTYDMARSFSGACYTLRISGFMDDVIFAHKLRLLDVAARLTRSLGPKILPASLALGLAINGA